MNERALAPTITSFIISKTNINVDKLILKIATPLIKNCCTNDTTIFDNDINDGISKALCQNGFVFLFPFVQYNTIKAMIAVTIKKAITIFTYPENVMTFT